MIESTISTLSMATRWLLVTLIVCLRPILGPPCRCRYYVSCTQFAVFQLENEPQFWRAIWLIFKRLASCHPFHSRQPSK